MKQLGMRETIKEGARYKNYEFKQAHGFRKFFKTRMEVAGVKPIVTETLMGQNIGVSASYFKPTNSELADAYSRAIDSLTIGKPREGVNQNTMIATFNRQFFPCPATQRPR